MKIITCASYYGTGSSAITDLISEFDNCKSLGNYEFRFVHDPEGISDLEHNLVENQNRHNSGRALKRYKKTVDFLSGNRFLKKYEGFFQNEFKKMSYNYIEELTEFKYNGYWHYDLTDKGMLYYTTYKILAKIVRRFAGFFIKDKERGFKLIRNEVTYCSYPTEAEFLAVTRKYLKDLFEIANKDNKEFLMVDQLVPPTNVDRYTRYFENIKIVVVDRDPRDLFLLENLYWKTAVIPRDVKTFCKWYEITRRHRKFEKYNEHNTILIQFEDLIYDYENSLDKIMKFLGLERSNHKYKKQNFNPDISIKNTRLYEKHPERDEEIQYIYKELKEFCYE